MWTLTHQLDLVMFMEFSVFGVVADLLYSKRVFGPF